MQSVILRSTAPSATVLIRVMVGWVFLSEGIQKFLFPAALGVGRFAKIGIPAPQFSGPFVGIVEVVCGALLIMGLGDPPCFDSAAHRHSGCNCDD
jgi:putative oxidoreductase